MINKLHYFSVILFILLFTCQSEPTQKINDLSERGLKGNVVLYTSGEGAFITEFNKNGNTSKLISIIKSLDAYVEFENLYTDNKLTKEISTIYYNGEKDVSVFDYSYELDSKNRIIKKIKTDGDFYDYIYDGDLMIEEKFESPFIRESKKYFYTNYNLDSILKTEFNLEINKLESKTTQYFNSNGTKVKQIKEKIGDKNLTESYYDENGLEEKTIKGDTITNITYDFDDNGNWVTSFHNNKKFNSRKIFYVGDDYSEITNSVSEYLKSLNNKLTANNQKSSNRNNNKVDRSYNYNNSNNNTSQNKACYSCNGSGQCPDCFKDQNVTRYHSDGSGRTVNSREKRPGMVVCNNCRGTGFNKGSSRETCYLCNGEGWTKCKKCNSGSGQYKGKCKRCKGSGEYP
jgi:hypothetical protein